MLSLRFLAIWCLLQFLGFNNCLDICGDWTQYKDIKCVKVLEKRSTEGDAVKACAELDSSSTLVSIHSKEEQDFLNTHLAQYSNTSIYAWIGMKYRNSSFKWLDQTVNNYTNWSDDAVRDGSEECVQMSLVQTNQGKWIDESCKRMAIAVCQKKQEMNLEVLRHAIEAIEQNANTIPLGFLYTQLPNQSSPQQLWPKMKWTEVTQQYSGLFFRAEGSDSESFGQIQHADQSKIQYTTNNYRRIDVTTPTTTLPTTTYGPTEKTTPAHTDMKIEWGDSDRGYANRFITLEITESEVRPKNTAIKIWKRIQ